MTPNATQERAKKLLQMYAELEQELLRRIGGALKNIDGANVPMWIKLKLSQTIEMRKTLEKAIADLEKQSKEERLKLMWSSHQEGADGLFRELGITGTPTARAQPIVALIDDMDGRFAELHRRILRDAEDVYRSVLAEALPRAVMGAETSRQAMQRAINAFADRGITAFVDKSGRRWGIAEYAEMATRTGMMHAMMSGYIEEAALHDQDLVIVSDHADECPLCQPWERKVLSLTGAMANHPDCDGTIGEAQMAGLFHPNCGHSITVYVPGLTDRSGSKDMSEAGQERDTIGYQNRQQQRYMERQVRRWKRRQASALTPEEERAAKAHVDQWQAKIRAAVARNNLPRMYHREGPKITLSEGAKRLRPFVVLPNGRAVQRTD